MLYRGPINIKVKDGRINIDGNIVKGTLGYYYVDRKNGCCSLVEYPNTLYQFALSELMLNRDAVFRPII